MTIVSMSALAPATGLRRARDRLLDFLLPPRCLGCGVPVAAAGTLCTACWRGITFLGAPCCACCGYPFDFDLGPGGLCGACLAAAPQFDRARAAMRYDDASRQLILALKHGDRLHLARPLAQWMQRAGAELLAGADLLLPVPLHWSRLCARGSDRPVVGRHARVRPGGLPVPAGYLSRCRANPSQVSKKAS